MTPEEKVAADALFDGAFSVDENDPEAHIPSLAERNENPIDFGSFLFKLGEKAEAAEQRGDREAVIKYYRALVSAVPEVSTSYAHLCKAYVAAGERAKAERSCELALTKRGVSPIDFENYVKLVLAQPEPLRPAQHEKLNTLIEHLKSKSLTRNLAWQLDCRFASRLADLTRLEACIGALSEQKAADATILPFRWKVAMLQHNYSEAASLVQGAGRAGVTDSDLQPMEEETQRVLHPPAPAVRSGLLSVRTKRVGILVAASLMVVATGLLLLWTRRASRSASKRPTA
jgi:tetratricopeptide (TPR) repeat protein